MAVFQAELQLGKQKVLADHIKTELESEIRSHKDCCTKAKFVEKQILVHILLHNSPLNNQLHRTRIHHKMTIVYLIFLKEMLLLLLFM